MTSAVAPTHRQDADPARRRRAAGDAGRTRSALVGGGAGRQHRDGALHAQPGVGRRRAARSAAARRSSRTASPSSAPNEAFTPAQLSPHDPRTAVGQRADGKILLVAVDGKPAGLQRRDDELRARARDDAARRGDGVGARLRRLDRDGVRRPAPEPAVRATAARSPVADALLVGVHAASTSPPPAEPVLSPNGDGVAEPQVLSYKLVAPERRCRRSLVGPGRHHVPLDSGARDARHVPLHVDGHARRRRRPRREGLWRFTVTATDDQGQASHGRPDVLAQQHARGAAVRPATVKRRARRARASRRRSRSRARRRSRRRSRRRGASSSASSRAKSLAAGRRARDVERPHRRRHARVRRLVPRPRRPRRTRSAASTSTRPFTSAPVGSRGVLLASVTSSLTSRSATTASTPSSS